MWSSILKNGRKSAILPYKMSIDEKEIEYQKTLSITFRKINMIKMENMTVSLHEGFLDCQKCKKVKKGFVGGSNHCAVQNSTH